MYPRIVPLALLLALPVLAACGEKQPEAKSQPQQPTRHVSSFQPQSVPEIGRLVPADAVVLAVFAPPARLEPKVDAFLSSVSARPQPVLDRLLAPSGATTDEIDADRPFAIALTLDEKKQPQPTFILPAKGGDYVAKGYAAPAAESAPPLARDLPSGDVAFRVDLARLIQAFRPAIDPYLSADRLVELDPTIPRDPATLATVDAMGAAVGSLLDAAERLDGALALDGGKVDLKMDLSVKTGSALDTPPVKGGAPFLDLAKSIDAKHCAMTMLVRGDFSSWMSGLMPFFRKMYDNVPDGEARLQGYMEAYRAVYAAMGPSFAASGDFGPEGMRLTGAMRPKDPANYLASYRKAVPLGSLPEAGVTIAVGKPVEADGIKLDVFHMTMDMSKLMGAGGPQAPDPEMVDKLMQTMFGPEGIRFAQGAVGDYVIMATPDANGSFDAAVATAKARSGGLAPAVAAAVRDDTTFLLHVDVRRMLAGISGLIATIAPDAHGPTITAGPPVDFWFRVDRSGRSYALALHADVGGVVALFR